MTRLTAFIFTIAAAALFPVGAPALAQSATQATSQQLQLVVFNRPGPNWAQRETAVPLLVAHQRLYRGLAASGEISFSGRSVGSPLGLSIFAHGVDIAAMRQRLEADPAVVGGFVALEFHTFVRSFTEKPAQGRP